MISNEMYLEIKGKWKSLYPIYFDSSKTIQQGIYVVMKAGGSPWPRGSKSQPLQNWQLQ